jgi:hypothetical protein
MLELAPIVLLNRLTNWGTAPVIATRAVAADVSTVHALLADPVNQRHLVTGVSPRLRPRVRMSARVGPRHLHASVLLGRRDLLWITWLLTPGRGTTEIDLAAQLGSHRVLARLVLLACRRRLLRQLEQALGQLAEVARRGAEECAEPEPSRRSRPRRGRLVLEQRLDVGRAAAAPGRRTGALADLCDGAEPVAADRLLDVADADVVAGADVRRRVGGQLVAARARARFEQVRRHRVAGAQQLGQPARGGDVADERRARQPLAVEHEPAEDPAPRVRQDDLVVARRRRVG